MSKKLIVAAKNFNGRRGTSLYCLSKETFEFVSKMKTEIRGQSFAVVEEVVKSNYATKTVLTASGVTYKVYDDFSVEVKGEKAVQDATVEADEQAE